MFFLSKEGRQIFESIPADPQNELAIRLACDQAAMMFSMTTITAALQREDIFTLIQRKATLADYVIVSLRTHLKAYRYVTEDFVTTDFNRVDLLRIARILAVYHSDVISRLGNLCKSLDHFSIPYLCTVVDNDGSKHIENYRREERITERVNETPRLQLGGFRPTDIAGRLGEFAEEQRIDDSLK